MGGLAHYFEADGLATTQISLLREHTAIMRPPRALFVPFDFGRPLGVPGDAAFQTRVVMAALGLLGAEAGPVLVDYAEEAPRVDDVTGWTCPINLPKPAVDVEARGPLLVALEAERERLSPWYDLAVETRGGTTVGSSGLAIEDIPAFITAFLDGEPPANPRPEVPLYDMLIFACDDLGAYYLEAVSAQPGKAVGAEIVDWFWGETTAAKVLWALRSHCRDSNDQDIQQLVDRFAPDHIVTRLSADDVSTWRT